MSFVLIMVIVWIMPLKKAGNIGPVRIVSKNESEKCPQTFCCQRLTQIRITRFHHRFLRKQEIVHYNQMAKELSLSTGRLCF
jgi:hypothetical protein